MLLPGSYQILTSHNIFISKKSNKISLSFFSPKNFDNIELFHLIDQGDFTYRVSQNKPGDVLQLIS